MIASAQAIDISQNLVRLFFFWVEVYRGPAQALEAVLKLLR
jgi:hypothetical protein